MKGLMAGILKAKAKKEKISSVKTEESSAEESSQSKPKKNKKEKRKKKDKEKKKKKKDKKPSKRKRSSSSEDKRESRVSISSESENEKVIAVKLPSSPSPSPPPQKQQSVRSNSSRSSRSRSRSRSRSPTRSRSRSSSRSPVRWVEDSSKEEEEEEPEKPVPVRTRQVSTRHSSSSEPSSPPHPPESVRRQSFSKSAKVVRTQRNKKPDSVKPGRKSKVKNEPQNLSAAISPSSDSDNSTKANHHPLVPMLSNLEDSSDEDVKPKQEVKPDSRSKVNVPRGQKRPYSVKEEDESSDEDFKPKLVSPSSSREQPATPKTDDDLMSYPVQSEHNPFPPLSDFSVEYLDVLQQVQDRIANPRKEDNVEGVVRLIQKTGCFDVDGGNVRFDLCLLDKKTVKKITRCLKIDVK